MVSERRKEQIRKAQETYRNKKRLERLLEIKKEQLEQSLPEVVDPLPDYNYHCPCGKECKDAKYDCKLSEEYHKCKYFLHKYPPPPTPPSNIKYPDEQERQFYEGLRDTRKRYPNHM